MLKIEKGIPIPPLRGQQSELRKTLKKMKVSESVLVERKNRAAARTAAKDIFGKGNYVTRTIGRKVRLWRSK